ncbi:MAG: gliding motility-associated C-terminal domain-containing protein [Saprospirales bacterium]|nr:gliding motility-associated C-terminal domain-containing protein [Saprospirales bacterium]
MKKILIPITGLLLSAIAVVAQPQLLENFESGNLSNWTLIEGNAGVTSSLVYGGNNSLEMGVFPDTSTLLLHKSFSGSFGRYQMYFYCEGPTPDFNFYFQYLGSNDFYQVSCKPLGTDNPELRLFKVVNGVYEDLAVENATFATDQWHELAVERSCNGNIEVFINGALQISVNDQDIQLPGSIGLGAWAELAYADDLSFERYVASVEILGDTTFCYDPTLLEASGTFSQYLWSTGSTRKSEEVNDPGMVWLEVTDANGCKAKDSVLVLTFCPSRFYVPNIFSPNYDGVNDLFQIYPEKKVFQFSMKVFDRWGELIFETQDLEDGWDGTYRGKTARPDMYMWIAQLDQFQLSGNVVLVR